MSSSTVLYWKAGLPQVSFTQPNLAYSRHVLSPDISEHHDTTTLKALNFFLNLHSLQILHFHIPSAPSVGHYHFVASLYFGIPPGFVKNSFYVFPVTALIVPVNQFTEKVVSFIPDALKFYIAPLSQSKVQLTLDSSEQPTPRSLKRASFDIFLQMEQSALFFQNRWAIYSETFERILSSALRFLPNRQSTAHSHSHFSSFQRIFIENHGNVCVSNWTSMFPSHLYQASIHVIPLQTNISTFIEPLQLYFCVKSILQTLEFPFSIRKTNFFNSFSTISSIVGPSAIS